MVGPARDMEYDEIENVDENIDVDIMEDYCNNANNFVLLQSSIVEKENNTKNYFEITKNETAFANNNNNNSQIITIENVIHENIVDDLFQNFTIDDDISEFEEEAENNVISNIPYRHERSTKSRSTKAPTLSSNSFWKKIELHHSNFEFIVSSQYNIAN